MLLPMSAASVTPPPIICVQLISVSPCCFIRASPSSQSSLGTGVTTWGIILPGSVTRRAAIEFTHWNSLQIEKRHESVASAVQTSLLLMNYSRAHFRGNEILNGVLRTSSAECMAELRNVIDLNGEPVVELMKRGKEFPVYTEWGGDRGEMIKDSLAVFSLRSCPVWFSWSRPCVC